MTPDHGHQSPGAPQRCVIGIDIGGTFADIILMDERGHLFKSKVSSSFSDPLNGIIAGVSAVLQEAGADPANVSAIVHGTTVATNTILEHRGAKTGLLTTAGFRDVLELARLRRPSSYDIFWDKPPPLVPRDLRLEIEERVRADGSIEVALNETAAREQIDRLIAAGAEAVAVCFLHSYANSSHERAVADILKSAYPALSCSASYEVLPEIKEFERTSTTVVNAYVKPAVCAYLDQFAARLAGIGLKCPLYVMQSNGGIIDVRTAREFPVTIIESGPAAGVLATSFLAKECSADAIIALDIGGTTAKASLVENGATTVSSEFEVGAGLNSGSRLAKGAGYPIRVPSVDIAEVGAGGGSIAWIDQGGALQVGPRSAGAEPGPACYGAGGTEPTVTDANVVLGYMNPSVLAGGRLKIDRALSVAAIKERIAGPLNLDLSEAAYGIHTIANANMIRAVRAVSTERGRDPREFLLVAFGGAGPIHAAGMAELLDIPQILIPQSPGLFSAVGLLFADTCKDFVKSILHVLETLDSGALAQEITLLRQAGLAYLSAHGVDDVSCHIDVSCDLRYHGQAHELTIPASGNLHDIKRDLRRDFGAQHERTYGHRGDDDKIELVNVRVRAIGRSAKVPFRTLSERSKAQGRSGTISSRVADFGPGRGMLECKVLPDRTWLQSGEHEGPLIIEEFDTTIVVPPGWRAAIDVAGNVSLRSIP